MVGAVAALGLCLPAAAAVVVVDDLEDGDGKNAFGQYWYSYQSGYASNITLTPGDPFTPSAGGANSSSYAAAITFNGLGNAGNYPEIAMGTSFTEDETVGYGTYFDNVDSISFWAKGPSGLKFYFNVHTEENAKVNENDNKYGKLITITSSDANAWKRYSFSLKPVVAPVAVGQDLSTVSQPDGKAGALTQAPYYGKSYKFVPAKVTKLSWAIKKEDNKNGSTYSPASGTFAVDDVTLIGNIAAPTIPVTPPPAASVCNLCVKTTFVVPTPSVLLTDFTTTKNALGGYGYSYSDAGSTDEAGTVGRGSGNNGLSTTFTIAGTDPDKRYAGVGFNLSDDNDPEKTPLNASGFTGIYFEYRTTGLEMVKVEFVDKAGVSKPEGKDFYINLPGTSGEWMSANIPFTALDVPSWVTPKPAFNKSNLAKIQIVSNVLGSGTIAIDNVYFLGDNKFPGQTAPPVDPPPGGTVTKYALTYKVDEDSHGWVSVNNERKFTITESVASGATGPTVTAIPSSSIYRFVKWDDENTNATRSDPATADKVFTAIFEPQKFTITYKAGDNGDLVIAGQTGMVTEYKATLAPGEDGPIVTAVGRIDPHYQFKRWDDGKATAARSDKVVNANLTFTAEFEPHVAPPVIEYKNVTYTAGTGGFIRVDYSKGVGFCASVDCNKNLAWADSLAPDDSIKVTAVPNEGYTFFRWSDNITTAARTDKYAGGEVHAEAIFNAIPTVPADPELKYFVLAYSVGKGGKIKEGNGALTSSIILNVPADSAGPTVTAVPEANYDFVKWSDGVTTVTRKDIAKLDSMLTAEFVSTDTASKTYRVTYVSGSGGNLSVNYNSVYVSRYDTTVAAGKAAAVIIAIADAGYQFVRWSSGSLEVQRYNTNVRADVSDTAIFEQRNIAVASPDREIPTAPVAEIAAIAPVAVIAGEFTAGPNPAAASVSFFRTGRAIKNGKLAVYDASGNLVAKVSLNDNGAGGKRAVGSWNLKDTKGRQVANGSYVVKGTITTKNGTREKVSTKIAVAR